MPVPTGRQPSAWRRVAFHPHTRRRRRSSAPTASVRWEAQQRRHGRSETAARVGGGSDERAASIGGSRGFPIFPSIHHHPARTTRAIPRAQSTSHVGPHRRVSLSGPSIYYLRYIASFGVSFNTSYIDTYMLKTVKHGFIK